MAEILAATSPRFRIIDQLRKVRRRRSKSTNKQLSIVSRHKEKCDSAIQVLETSIQTPRETPPQLSVTESLSPHVLKTDPIPTTQKALLVISPGTYSLEACHPVPLLLAEGEVLIKTHTVGLNPIDWKSVAYNFCLPSFPWITGRELAGTVVAIGSGISHLTVGEPVWTSTYYKDVRAGCFQEYVMVPGHTVMAIPKGVEMESASCLGVAGLTAAMTLWKWLGADWPLDNIHGANKNEWLLIWGGSTVTGQFATQLAILSGLRVVTVTSSATRSLSLSLGATHVVTRDGKTDEELVQEIKSVTKGSVTRAIDLVGPKTASLVLRSVSSRSPVAFAPLAMMSSDQEIPANITVHTVEMKQFVLDADCRKYALWLNALVADTKLEFPELRIIDGGLESITEGLDLLKKGNMGGKKLVVRY